MATMLEECITKEQHSVVHFLWAKGLSANYVHKEMFSVCVGKCLSCKGVPPCGKHFADDEEFETEVRKCLRQQSKYFCAVGFDVLIK
jgi:hypothetical protein